MKKYNHNGLKGCVAQRTNRQTGTTIGIYHGRQSGIGKDEKWVCLCEDHGHIASFEVLARAKKFAPRPVVWCSECQKLPFDTDGNLLVEGDTVKVIKGKDEGVTADIEQIFDNFGLGAVEADLLEEVRDNGKTTERIFTKKLDHLRKID